MKKTAAMFDAWNELKKKLEFGKSRKKDAKVGEIWWYWEGVNIGSEISKDSKFIRPCLIFQSHLGNGLICIIPITSSQRQLHYNGSIEIRYPLSYNLKKQSRLLCQQSKCIDPKRLLESITSTKKIKGAFFTLIQKTFIEVFTKQKTP